MQITSVSKITLSIASDSDRKNIYKLRHQVYAKELKQHTLNSTEELRDNLDLCNHYIVAKQGGTVVGFVSITSPSSSTYSVDKYFNRCCIPYPFDDYLYEIRLLTIVEARRKNFLALALMFAAFRWVQSHGGRHIVSICRSDIIDMYKKAGLQPLNKKTISGMVSYDLCVTEVEKLERIVKQNVVQYQALQFKIDWQLPFAFFIPSACYHGGSFFKAIGEDLQNLETAKNIINADVLDAWFPPSPNALNILQQYLPWLLQTSPPTHSDGLISVIEKIRGIKNRCILPGAGSSDLIFLAFKTFLSKSSRVLIIDPCYGEYIHVLENIIQCHINRFVLSRKNGFVIDTSSLLNELQKGYDMVVIVNPNSPTGVYIQKKEMEELLLNIPLSTIVWVDETYIEYAGKNESLEQFASGTENVIVCKSMSKTYALSGVRSAYLSCSPHFIETLKSQTPPWAISLPAQAAAIAALKDEDYYTTKYSETCHLREKLKEDLISIGISEIIEGVANFLLFYLPAYYSAKLFLRFCQDENLFLRDVGNMGKSLGANAIRIAVKDGETNKKMIQIMKNAMKKIGDIR
jgi:histidinol-phosphate/aromatic aminotransferase/cobyric acid decarboxylase-like protein/N-acyl-L-homoserine lactone synthetase